MFNNPRPRILRTSTAATLARFAPFPSIWRRFSSCPVLVPVQKFNAIKQPPFRFRCKLLTFTDFVDLFRGGIVARLWQIVEIWGVSVRNRADLIFEHALKSAYCRVLFILSLRLRPRSDFLPNVVQIGLFLLSALAYSKNPFYLCTSNPPKGVARSFKDFPPASLRHSFHFSNLSGHASATHEELKTAFCYTTILTLSKPLPPYTFPPRT